MSHWMDFFEQTIEAIHERLSVVLQASGCREGWLQGEFFLAGQKYKLHVNEFRLGNHQKADLSCNEDPKMLAELKIVGADYLSKMRAFIESDVERMERVSTSNTERFMILVIPYSEVKSKLGEFLDSCSFSPEYRELNWPGFRVRIWKF